MSLSEIAKPYDPYCGRWGAEMAEYDSHIFETVTERDDCVAMGEIAVARERYIVSEEGTYNQRNGHFACDTCYMELGGPSGVDGMGGPGRWVAP